MAIDLTKLANKRNNSDGDDGVLLAEEFNSLVQAVIENQKGLKDVESSAIKGIKLNSIPYTKKDKDGLVEITLTDSNYLLDLHIQEAPGKYIAKGAPCRFRFTITHKNIKESNDDENKYVYADFGAVAKFHWVTYKDGVLEDEVVGTVTNIYDKNAAGSDKLGIYDVTEVVFDYNGKANLTTADSGNTFYIELTNNLGGTTDVVMSSRYTSNVFNMSVKTSLRHANDKSGVTLPIFTKDDFYNILVQVTGSRAKVYLQIDDKTIIGGETFGQGQQKEYKGEDALFSLVNTHGIHEIKTWATPINQNGVELDKSIKVEGETIRYIFGKEETPIIMSSIDNTKSYEQYSKLPVEYIAYYKDRSADINVDLNITNSNNDILFSTTQVIEFVNSAGSGMYIFTLTPKATTNILGDNKLNIIIGEGENIFIDTTNITVVTSTAELDQVDGYKVYLTSAGRSNDENKEIKTVWNSELENETVTHVTFDETIEFNEAGSGWNPDKNGNIAMHLKKNKYFTLDYKPFLKNPFGTKLNPGTGLTISIEFATIDCLSQDAEVISCYDDSSNIGFKIFANKVLLSSQFKKLTCDFAENTRVKLDIVIEGKQTEYPYDTVVGTDGKRYTGKSDEALMIIFIDGVYQRLSLIPAGDSFMQAIAQNIKFGSDKCDLDIYNIKIYEQALNIDQIVKNYAFDTPEYSDKVAIAKRNDIFDNPEDNRPNIDIGKLTTEARKKLPIVYITMKDNVALPNNKSDWKALSYAAYVNPSSKDKKDIGNSSWETIYGAFRNQGTSSMNYPWPWRNWDFKLDKYKDDAGNKHDGFFEIPKVGGETSEKWLQYLGMPKGISKITWKKDYASSEMCNNAICSELFTDMAIGICARPGYENVLSSTMRKNGDATDYRLTFKATPCFMFNKIEDGVNETVYEPMGMMNLIPNKNECGYLGFIDGNVWEDGGTKDKDGNEILKPRAQSWEICENHIFWDYELHSYHAAKYNVGDQVLDYTVETTDGQKSNNYFAKVDIVYQVDEDGEFIEDENGDKIPVYLTETGEDTNDIEAAAKDENGNPVVKQAYQSFGNFINGVDGNYEARYPKDSTSGFEDFGYFGKSNTVSEEDFDKVYNEHKDILDLHNWLVSCNQGLATNELLTEEVLNSELWNKKQDGSYKYYNDTVEYRRDKFKNEGAGYTYTAANGESLNINGRLLIDQWVLYYIWREQFWMFDSGSKNLQIYTMDERYNTDSYDGILTWGCMVRDADTALGIDNIGVDKFPAHLEDIDYYTEADGNISFTYGGAENVYTVDALTKKHTGAQQVLNGQFGAIWLNIRDCFADRIEEMYKALVSDCHKTNFSAENAIKRFDDHQDNWCEALYNFGMRQYFGGTPFSDRITSGNGNKRAQRKSWLEKGFYYRNSKYNNLSDVFNFRGFVYNSEDKRDNVVNIKTYIPMYIAMGGDDQTMAAGNSFRITNPNIGCNVPISKFNLPANSGDKNLYYFGSSYTTDLGDYARYFIINDITTMNFPKLTSLKLGDKTGKYTRQVTDENTKVTTSVKFYNDTLKNLDCSSLPALSYLDITNYTQLGTGDKGLIISENKQLEELYAQGTHNITKLDFPETSTLRIAKIGGGLRSLVLKNLTGLEEFTYDSLSYVENVEIINCSDKISKSVDKTKAISLEIIESCIDSLEAKYKTNTVATVCQLHGIDWTSTPITDDLLVRLANITQPGNIKGKIKLSKLSYKNKITLLSKFGEIDDPNNGLHVTYTPANVNGIEMLKTMYIMAPGSYQMYFNPKNVNGNNFTRYEWSVGLIENNVENAVSVEINSKTGILHVTGIGTEANKERVTVSVIVYNKNYETGEEVEIGHGSTLVNLYERKARIGDIVYHDGTYTSYEDLDNTKTPIGMCFYIHNENSENPRRLLMAFKPCNITDGNFCFGPEYDHNDVDDIDMTCTNYLKDNLDRFTTLSIKNLMGENLNTTYNVLRENNNWTYLLPNQISSTIGLREITNDDMHNNELPLHYKVGDFEWFGKYNTASIIQTRNLLLEQEGYTIPNNTTEINGKVFTELEHTLMLINEKINNASSGDHKYYYPIVSWCYAYEPVLAENQTLDSKFTAHNWWLPSYGETLRMLYFYVLYTKHKQIITNFEGEEQVEKITEFLSAFNLTNDELETLNILKPIFDDGNKLNYTNENSSSITSTLTTSEFPKSMNVCGYSIYTNSNDVTIGLTRYSKHSAANGFTVRPICEF